MRGCRPPTGGPAGRHGASVNPQLLITTEVTPWVHEQLPSGSHITCASMWVWPSMKPGETIKPVGIDGACRAPASHATEPDNAPALDADIGDEAPAPPEPSTTVPFLTNKSSAIAVSPRNLGGSLAEIVLPRVGYEAWNA